MWEPGVGAGCIMSCVCVGGGRCTLGWAGVSRLWRQGAHRLRHVLRGSGAQRVRQLYTTGAGCVTSCGRWVCTPDASPAVGPHELRRRSITNAPPPFTERVVTRCISLRGNDCCDEDDDDAHNARRTRLEAALFGALFLLPFTKRRRTETKAAKRIFCRTCTRR